MAEIPNCTQCRKPLPTVRVTEDRGSGVYKYPVINHTDLICVKGRWQHQDCEAHVDFTASTANRLHREGRL